MKNIFIGNLSFQVSESELRSAFEQYGQVLSVNMVTDRETGRARGFAFLEMANADEADRAIAEMNGKLLEGRKLTVNEARPKKDRGGFGRDGGHSFRPRRESRW
ncbi:MAG: RNA-binding protein [Acidobacteria bacterium]|nr:RNA-binding protein [Acidobacteriota bacterium]